ncbi:RDD family protein [Chromatiaceae bacterium AAb-1]|nr:RDD family protein [Chromatiaceae bacterium AAb-1]
MFSSAPRAGFARRLAAMIYDWLILCALIMFAAAIAMLFVQVLAWCGLVSLHGYADIADYLNKGWQRWVYLAYLVATVLGFYVYFWCKGGQTLGMRAWRLLLLRQDNGHFLPVSTALARALLALGGLGNFWLWLRWGKGLALQDQLTGSQMVVISKEQSRELNLHKLAR